jgi:hypothetical protein
MAAKLRPRGMLSRRNRRRTIARLKSAAVSFSGLSGGELGCSRRASDATAPTISARCPVVRCGRTRSWRVSAPPDCGSPPREARCRPRSQHASIPRASSPPDIPLGCGVYSRPAPGPGSGSPAEGRLPEEARLLPREEVRWLQCRRSARGLTLPKFQGSTAPRVSPQDPVRWTDLLPGTCRPKRGPGADDLRPGPSPRTRARPPVPGSA